VQFQRRVLTSWFPSLMFPTYRRVCASGAACWVSRFAYDRPAARFAYLVRGHIQIMLCERNGNWEVGELSPPFGRGVNFQMTVSALHPILAALKVADWPLFRQPNDAWYRGSGGRSKRVPCPRS
jgi:hypothetical protein